ncbi:hypothetical protein [Nocardia goodfellowii]|uniref:Uncharacterized protein n=1 Tax=Nocardia goodfellowii TaxID=882446 RepID=A0ABS4QMB0_9NOCA|nr:hypothetical protein [Nocardia goodfellowii]MBP2191801.1 hypothetical protein [Nocardia goodfellowii]
MTRLLVTAASAGVSAGFLSTIIPVAIWPGEAKLTAPLFCSAPATEPIVVSDTFHDSEGTSTNYTLYCVDERGALTNEGFALPMLALFTAHVLILTTLILLATLVGRARARQPSDRLPSDRLPEDAREYPPL